MANAKLTQEQVQEVIRRYSKGESSLQIAPNYDVCPKTIRNTLKRQGIDRRRAGTIRHCTLDETAFDEPLTETARYFIGLLMADGCVNWTKGHSPSICLGLKTEDEEIVLAFRKFLGSTHKIRRQVLKTTPMSYVAIRSLQLVTQLARYGVVPAKSHISQVYYLESDRDFWRGVIDGDGCICVYAGRPRLILYGSKYLCEQFNAFVKEFCPTHTAEPSSGSGVYRLGVNGPNALQMFMILYGKCGVALERKRKKAIGLIFNSARANDYDAQFGQA